MVHRPSSIINDNSGGMALKQPFCSYSVGVASGIKFLMHGGWCNLCVYLNMHCVAGPVYTYYFIYRHAVAVQLHDTAIMAMGFRESFPYAIPKQVFNAI